MSLLQQLSLLPGSYEGPTRQADGPHGLIGLGEAQLAARICEPFAQTTLTREGTQLLLGSPETEAAAADFAALAEVNGVPVLRAGAGEGSRFDLDTLSFLAPGGVLGTYHLAQFVAHATGHGEEVAQAEALLKDVRDRCAPEAGDDNPARTLAWSLWGRSPLLLAPEGESVLSAVWQGLLARVGKVLSIPVEQPLYALTGAFEARHERGDGRLALILGEEDAEMALCREVLETRIDEVVLVEYPGGSEGGYAGTLALWYYAAWVAAYLAEREGVSAEDSPALTQVLATFTSSVPGDELN